MIQAFQLHAGSLSYSFRPFKRVETRFFFPSFAVYYNSNFRLKSFHLIAYNYLKNMCIYIYKIIDSTHSSLSSFTKVGRLHFVSIIIIIMEVGRSPQQQQQKPEPKRISSFSIPTARVLFIFQVTYRSVSSIQMSSL